jgi:hypothetical protein
MVGTSPNSITQLSITTITRVINLTHIININMKPAIGIADKNLQKSIKILTEQKIQLYVKCAKDTFQEKRKII